MHLVDQIKKAASEALLSVYQVSVPAHSILVNATKPEFEGNYTVVLFAFVKELKLSPDALGEALGNHLVASNPHLFTAHNTIKGFLNLTIADAFWFECLNN
ncbi:MAG: arginine--tRNA ligase, partial [Bacteroidetes bacterium]|nr:arginine--tRNA ligase [Bacteroidota bacterium]